MPLTESTPLLPSTQSSAIQALGTTSSSNEPNGCPFKGPLSTIDKLSCGSLPSRWKKSLVRGLAVMGTVATLSLNSLPRSPRDHLCNLDKALTQKASVICVETPGDTAVDRVTSDAEWFRPASRNNWPDPACTVCTVFPSSLDDKRLNSTILLRPEKGEPIEVSRH